MDLGLKGKVAVVSGGSVGIGLAVAQALAEEGVQLVLCARNEARVVERAEEIAGRYGVRAIGVGADVAEASGVEKVLERTLATFDGADILINNAGTGSNETIQEAADEKWQYYWDLHTMAAVRLS